MRALTGLTFTTTGFTRDEQDSIRAKIVQHGGFFSVDVISNTTHIIAALGSTKKCLVARQMGNIQIVLEKWLDRYIESPDPEVDFSDDYFAKSFTGYVVCITGLTPESRNLVRQCVEKNGGKYQGDLDANVTHLIVPMSYSWKDKVENRKISFATKNDISIVYECWVNAMQSGFVIESEITDICRATPFHDVNEELEIIENASNATAKRPVIEPYSAAEAKHFCDQRVQEGVWGQKNEEGMRSSLYAAFRSSFSSSLPENEDSMSPLLKSQKLSSPTMAAAIASQKISKDIQKTSIEWMLQEFLKTDTEETFFRGVRAYFVGDSIDDLAIGECGLFPSFRDPLTRVLSQKTQQQSEEATIVPLMKRALVHAYGLPLPFLTHHVNHIIVPCMKKTVSSKLSLSVENHLRSTCERLRFPLARVVTSHWILESIQNKKKAPLETFGYNFGTREFDSFSQSQYSDSSQSYRPSKGAFMPLGSPPDMNSMPKPPIKRPNESPEVPKVVTEKKPSATPTEDKAYANKKPKLPRPFKKCVFRFDERFDAARQNQLVRIIEVYGGTIETPDTDENSSKRMRHFLIHPHEFELAHDRSQCSPSLPWNKWISPSDRSQGPKSQKRKMARRQHITSSWVLGFLAAYWNDLDSDDTENDGPPLKTCQKFFTSKPSQRSKKRKREDRADPPFSWWYTPIVKKEVNDNADHVVLFIPHEYCPYFTTIRTVVTALGGEVTKALDSRVTHALPSNEIVSESIQIVSLPWLEACVSTGYLLSQADENASPQPSLTSVPNGTEDKRESLGENLEHTAELGISPPITSPILPNEIAVAAPPVIESPVQPVKNTPLPTIGCTPSAQFQGAIRIAFSLTQNEEVDSPKNASILRTLGAAVVKDIQTREKYPPTHLIASVPSPRLVVLCGLARGMWILRPEYVEECCAKNQLLPEIEFEWKLNSVPPRCRVITVQQVTTACRVWRERRERSKDPGSFGAFQGLKIALFAKNENKRKQFQLILEAGNVATLTILNEMPEGGVKGHSMVLLDREASDLLRETQYSPPERNVPPIYTDRWLFYHLTCQPTGSTKLYV